MLQFGLRVHGGDGAHTTMGAVSSTFSSSKPVTSDLIVQFDHISMFPDDVCMYICMCMSI